MAAIARALICVLKIIMHVNFESAVIMFLYFCRFTIKHAVSIILVRLVFRLFICDEDFIVNIL